LRAESPEARERKAFLRGLKMGRLYEEIECAGAIYCAECGQEIELNPEAEDWLVAAMGSLDTAHRERRSQGQGYSDRRWPEVGVDHPSNIDYPHRRCHQLTHKGSGW
jgi:hypothetical protein